MMCTLLAASTCTLDTPYFVHRHMPAMSRQTVLHHWLLFTLSVVCLGHMGNEGTAGLSVAAQLEDLHNDFCGCRAIDGNIRILMSTSFPDFNSVSLTEANFTFFNEITEVSGYFFLQNIPTLSLLTSQSEQTIWKCMWTLAIKNCDSPGQGGTMHCVPASTRNAGLFTITPFTMTLSTGQLSTHVPLLLRLLHACILNKMVFNKTN